MKTSGNLKPACKFFYVLSWSKLSAVMLHICIIQEANESAKRGFRDLGKFRKKAKMHNKSEYFPFPKRKQAENFSSYSAEK